MEDERLSQFACLREVFKEEKPCYQFIDIGQNKGSDGNDYDDGDDGGGGGGGDHDAQCFSEQEYYIPGTLTRSLPLSQKHKKMEVARGLRVLLVAEDGPSRNVVSALLHSSGYEVITQACCKRAWEFLCGHPHTVDLVLTEVFIPELSGIGLLSKIAAETPLKHMPVVMMSSDESIELAFECLSHGAADFLIKPVRKKELRNMWQHVWRRNSKLISREHGWDEQNTLHSAEQLDSSRGSTIDEFKGDSCFAHAEKGWNDGDNESATQGSWSRPSSMMSSRTHKRPACEIEDGEVKSLRKGCHVQERSEKDGGRAGKATDLYPWLSSELSMRIARMEDVTKLQKGQSLRQSMSSAFYRYSGPTNCVSKEHQGLNQTQHPPSIPSVRNLEDLSNHNRVHAHPSFTSSVAKSSSYYLPFYVAFPQHHHPPDYGHLGLCSHLQGGTFANEIEYTWSIHTSRASDGHDIQASIIECSSTIDDDGGVGTECLRTVNQVNAMSIDSIHTKQQGQNMEISTIAAVSKGSRADVNNPNAQRAAALLKFRHKRNERCFAKKIRYESRKKMAEKRPRVKGQFVKQVVVMQKAV